MGLDELVQKVRHIQQTVRYNENLLKKIQRESNTEAVVGIYSSGSVIVDGTSYPCFAASRDVLVKDGSMVWCLPTKGGYAIVGGGIG